MPGPLRIAAAAATLAILCTFGWVAAAVRGPTLEVPSVQLQMPPRQPELWQSWLARQAESAERREVLLDVSGEFFPATRNQLGLSIDRPRVLESLTDAASPLGLWQRVTRAIVRWRDDAPPAKDLPLHWVFNRDQARAFFESLAPVVDIAPRDARLDFTRHLLEPDAAGRRIDVERTLSEVANFASRSTSETIQVFFLPVEPQVTLADLPPVDPRKVLAVFETDFSKKRGPRIANIRRAARYLDGTVLAPGATLSFNGTVGPRTARRGFVDAPVIVNDEMESGMGGGVCQVATTLHAAAVYGALEVTERRSHSRPSGYAALGLDATVLDGVQDLKLRNPYAVSIYVRAYLPSRYVIRVELLGAEVDGEVGHSYRVLERHAYTRRIVEKPELPAGTFKLSQKGGYGYDTLSSVVLTRSDGVRRERRYKSKYYPVPEVLWIGPGTHSDVLPPPPSVAQ